MRSPLATVSVVLALALTACGTSSPSHHYAYPANLVSGFLDNCRTADGSTPAQCNCQLAQLQATIPADRLVAASLLTLGGADFPPAYLAAVKTCGGKPG